MMMEDLNMLDAIYTTDAEMADYDFDYDIPESVMQDEAVPVSATTDDFDYTSTHVQEYDMLEDGHENFSSGIVVPTAETVIGAEPVQISEVAIVEPVNDVATVIQVEALPEDDVALPVLITPLPTPSQDHPFPALKPDTPPDSNRFEIAPAPPIVLEHEPSIITVGLVASASQILDSQPEPPTSGSPQQEINQEQPVAHSPTPEDQAAISSPHSEIPPQSLAETTPNPSQTEIAPQVVQEKPITTQAIPDVPSHHPVVLYHCDQPYQLFSLQNLGQTHSGEGDDVEPPSVLLSGQSELFVQPLASLFQSIREQEKANFSWISDQYLIGLENSPLELYIDESSVYAHEVSLADMCRAVKACGHEQVEFTIYQSDNFKYSLQQRLNGIPPPLPEGSSESQEEEEDILEYHTQQIVGAQDDQPPEISQASTHEVEIVATASSEAPAVEPLIQTTQETERVDETDNEDGSEEAEYEESHPTEATAEENPQEDGEQQDDLDQTDLNENESLLGADAEQGGAFDLATLNEQQPPEQSDQTQLLADESQTKERLEHVSVTGDALHNQPDNEVEYPDDASDGTLESSQQDVEEYAAENEDLDGDGEPDDDPSLNQTSAPNEDEQSTSDAAEKASIAPTPDDVDAPHNTVLADGANAYEDGNTNEWNETEPSAEGSAVPDDFDEYSYYDEAEAGYQVDEPTEDSSLVNLAEEVKADGASLIDFKEDVAQVTRVTTSPLSKGKRALSEIDETLYGAQYTDKDPHADSKRARVG